MEANSCPELSPMRHNGFKDLFLDIWTAQMEPRRNTFFTITQLREPPFKILSSAACEKLESELREAASEQTFVDILSTASLMQLQDICIDAMKSLESVRESEPLANQYTTLIVDILSSSRIALLLISLKPEMLELQSEDVLRLSLRNLSSILSETQEATSSIWNEATRTLRALNGIVTKVGLDVVLPELEELVLRIIHPSFRDSLSGNMNQNISTLIDSAVELTLSIFLQYSEERSALIAAAVSIAMADARKRHDCPTVSMPRNKKSIRRSSVLFASFVEIYILPSGTAHSVPDQPDREYPGAQITPRRPATLEETRQCLEAAETCAQQIISSLLAIDQSPHCRLSTLQVLCEDLVQTVRSPEGVGAEVLLRCLLHCMLKLANDSDRRHCPSLLSLQLLRTMGEAIAYLYAFVQRAVTADQTNDLYGPIGVYRTVIDHIRWNARHNIHTGAARAYLIAVCAQNAFSDTSRSDEEMENLKEWLEQAIDGPSLRDSFFETSSCHKVWPKQVMTAYLITLLSTHFFQGLERILTVMRDGLEDDSVIIRLKSWKGLIGIYNNNMSILRQTKGVVAGCLSDPSARVREAALISLQENDEWMTSLVENAQQGGVDKSPAIRKQFIWISEKSYLTQSQVALAAACHMLRAVVDDNAGVAAAAQKALARLWLPSGRNAVLEERLERTLNTISFVVQQHPGLESCMCQFFALHRKSADVAKCKLLVAAALRKVTRTLDGGADTCQMLDTLAVFAKAKGCLFTTPPYHLFQSYLSRSSMETNSSSFGHVASIFIHVVGYNSDFDRDILSQLENTLLRLLTICKDDEKMEHATKCLWTASNRLKTYSRLFKIIASLEQLISRLNQEDLTEPIQGVARVKARRSIKLIGLIGRNFFDNCIGASLEIRFYHWYPKSIIDLLLQIHKRRSCSMSCLALQSVCRFCHAWPSYIINDELTSVFHEVLIRDDECFQIPVIEALLQCLLSRERDLGQNDNTEDSNEGEDSLRDQVALLSIEQHLPSILQLAMRGHCRRTLVITEYIVTVSVQGLVCPSKVYPILVALGTSPNTETARIANREHIRMHNLKQSAIETSYIETIRQSFFYQQENSSGPVKLDPHASLRYMFAAINSGSKLLREAFLRQICSELTITVQDTQKVKYVRYILENLAFYAFEYPRDLTRTISDLKHIITVQQPVIVHGMQDILGKYSSEYCPASMSSEDELLQMTTRYVAISIVWEGYNFLQAQSTVSKHSKDFNGAILKYHRDQGSLLLKSVEKRFECFTDTRTMLAQCQNFISHGFLGPTAQA